MLPIFGKDLQVCQYGINACNDHGIKSSCYPLMKMEESSRNETDQRAKSVFEAFRQVVQ